MILFSSQYWNLSSIRNGHISTTCSNGSNNSALVFGEGISNLPYRNFIASHSAITNVIKIIDDTNDIPPTLLTTHEPVNSSQIYNRDDDIPITVISTEDYFETQTNVSYRTSLFV